MKVINREGEDTGIIKRRLRRIRRETESAFDYTKGDFANEPLLLFLTLFDEKGEQLSVFIEGDI